jgi:hypothetical protein
MGARLDVVVGAEHLEGPRERLAAVRGVGGDLAGQVFLQRDAAESPGDGLGSLEDQDAVFRQVPRQGKQDLRRRVERAELGHGPPLPAAAGGLVELRGEVAAAAGGGRQIDEVDGRVPRDAAPQLLGLGQGAVGRRPQTQAVQHSS